jgi:iron(III) transport system permease protein
MMAGARRDQGGSSMSALVRDDELRPFSRIVRIGGWWRAWPWIGLAIVIFLLVAWPVLQVMLQLFADGGSAFGRLLKTRNIGGVIRDTAIIGVGSATIALAIGTFLAWASTRLTRRARRVVGLIAMLPLIVPTAATIIGWTFLLSPQVGYINRALRATPFFGGFASGPLDIYSLPGIVIIQAFTLTSFVYLFIDTSLRNMGQDYERAAAAHGAGELRTFFKVTLPLLRPAIAYAYGTVLLIGLGSFTGPLLLGGKNHISTLTVEIFQLKEDSYPVDYPLAAALSLPIILMGIAVVLGQRFFIGNQRRYIVAPSRTQYADRSRSSWWAIAVIALYGILSALLPLLALIHVSLQPYWSGKLTFSNLTFESYQSVLGNPRLTAAIVTSLQTSLVAVLIMVPLGFLCARALQQSSQAGRTVRGVIDNILNLPLALPGTLFGLGLLFTFSQPPLILYGTPAILVITYIALQIPHATRIQLSTLISIGDDPREAAAASGSSPLRTMLLIVLPMARKGAAAAAALIYVLLVHEFSASLMVRAANTPVLGTVLWEVWANGLYPEVAVFALTTVAVTTAGVLFAVAVGGRDSLGSL